MYCTLVRYFVMAGSLAGVQLYLLYSTVQYLTRSIIL
jgi:hypothetical protein